QSAQQSIRDTHPWGVVERVRGARAVVGLPGEFEGFLPIGRDQGETREVEPVDRFGIEAEPETATAAEALELVEQRLCDDALAVVADDDRVGCGQFFLN